MANYKTDSNDVLWADLKEIQASMAIEGYAISEKELIDIERRCKNNSTVRLLPELKQKAEREGRALADILNERLGLNIVFHGDDVDV